MNLVQKYKVLWNPCYIHYVLCSLVNGGREEGDDSLLWHGHPAGHPVTGERTAHVSRLVPYQHDQSRRGVGQRLADLGYNSIQVRGCVVLMLLEVLIWDVSKSRFLLFAVTHKKKDQLTSIKHGCLGEESSSISLIASIHTCSGFSFKSGQSVIR